MVDTEILCYFLWKIHCCDKENRSSNSYYVVTGLFSESKTTNSVHLHGLVYFTGFMHTGQFLVFFTITWSGAASP